MKNDLRFQKGDIVCLNSLDCPMVIIDVSPDVYFDNRDGEFGGHNSYLCYPLVKKGVKGWRLQSELSLWSDERDRIINELKEYLKEISVI